MNFDMNTVWSRGLELITSNFQLLVALAAVFFLLPSIAVYFFIPNLQALSDPSADPEAVMEMLGEMIGSFLLFGSLGFIVQFAGYGAMIALMGRDRPTVGQAIVSGFKIVPSTFALFILWMLGYFIGSILIILPFSILGGLSESPALVAIGFVPVFIFVIWLMARFSMSMPTLILQPTLNPISAIVTSFKLTGPKQWMILLFWTVLMVIYVVINLLVTGLISVVIALLSTGTTALLLLGLTNGLMTMAISILICGLSVAMYYQLAGVGTAEIAETFD